jgi:probable HAF family extracellular repeat protein
MTDRRSSGPAFAIVPLPGGADGGGTARAVNDAGNVVGSAFGSAADTGVAGQFAAFWQPSPPSLFFLAYEHNAESGANAINASGQVVGQMQDRFSGEQHAFLSQDIPQSIDAQDLGLGPDSVANSINATGDIVGAALVSSPGGQPTNHAILWHNPQTLDLGSLGGTLSVANAINDAGQIVGQSRRRDGKIHAFLWQNGKMRDLGTLGGSASDAFAISASGDVVGNAALKGDKDTRAFLWHRRRRAARTWCSPVP